MSLCARAGRSGGVSRRKLSRSPGAHREQASPPTAHARDQDEALLQALGRRWLGRRHGAMVPWCHSAMAAEMEAHAEGTEPEDGLVTTQICCDRRTFCI